VAGAQARFLREAQLTSRVRHPHTVDVTDLGTEGGQTFLVMEYLEGEDLARHIERGGPMSLGEVVDIALPVMAAVAAAHDEGIIHRDLKPQNIFLARTREGAIHPKVLDFGISKSGTDLQGAITSTGAMMGSPSYFSPEQVQDTKAVTSASDQYALGLILYECVTGRVPYEGENLYTIFKGIVAGEYQPAQQSRPDLPEGFHQIIERAMSVEPGDRFPTVKEMGRALMAFASPKTRLLWEDCFGKVAPAPVVAGAAGARRGAGGVAESPVPVTVQTPAAARPAMSVTAPIPGTERREGEPVLSDPSISIPRRSRLPWVVAALVLAGGAVVALLTLGGKEPARPTVQQATTVRPTSPPAAASSQTQTRSQSQLPARPVASTARATDRTVDERAEAAPAETSGARIKGRAPAKPRFGSNRAPLIE
jgi:serine/threonine-protein kinase